RLEAVAPNDPELTGLVFIDPQGRVRALSLPAKAEGIGQDLSPQQQIRDTLADGRPAIGDPRVGTTTGQPLVPFTQPVRAPDGRLIGVLQAGLSLARLSEQLGAVRVGQHGYVSVSTRERVILAHP